MCKLVIISKQLGENSEAENLLRLQFEELKTQRDGCGALTIDSKNRVKVYRELTDYDKVFKAVLKDFATSKFVSIHTRIGTSGGHTLDNVHFFKPKDWYFAHNGFVGKFHPVQNTGEGFAFPSLWENQGAYQEKYGSETAFTVNDDGEPVSYTQAMAEMVKCRGCDTAKRGYCKIHEPLVQEIAQRDAENEPVTVANKFCDSYQFAEALPAKVNEKTLIGHMAETSFNGMGLLVNNNGKDIYALIAKECFAVTDHSSYAGFFSYKPELKADITSNEELCGLKVRKSKATLSVNVKPTEIVKGVYKFHNDTPKKE